MTITITRNTVLAGSATAAEMITRAYRRLQATDINSEPSDTEMDNALQALSEMVDSWAHPAIELSEQVIEATTTNGDATVTFETNVKLADDLNVSGTGIPANTTIESVTNETEIELSANATASGTVNLTFTPVPFPARHRAGIIAMLAAYMADDLGLSAPARVIEDANEGWLRLLADYLPDKKTTFDPALSRTNGTFGAYTNLFGD